MALMPRQPIIELTSSIHLRKKVQPKQIYHLCGNDWGKGIYLYDVSNIFRHMWKVIYSQLHLRQELVGLASAVCLTKV